MAYRYLSFFIDNDTPQYGGDKSINIKQRSSILNGDSSNSKLLELPNHVGTHIDFPKHFGPSGKTINDYPASFWIFNHPYILNYSAKPDEIIELSGLIEEIPEVTDILIIKTGFQTYRGLEKYWKNNPGLSPELAQLLKKRCNGLRIIGFDFISLSSYQNREVGRIAHRKFLLENNLLIIEDMNLADFSDKVNKIIVLPLMINKADGSPVTIIARHD